jgi:hypothetical protein
VGLHSAETFVREAAHLRNWETASFI